MTGSERHPDLERGFGRDGISGLVDPARAMRARDVSRPTDADLAAATDAAKAALGKLDRPRQ